MDLKYRTSVSDDKCMLSFWSIHATYMYLKAIAWITKCIRQLQFSPYHLGPLVYRNVFPHSMKQYTLYSTLRQHISICCHVHTVSVLIHKALVNGLWLHHIQYSPLAGAQHRLPRSVPTGNGINTSSLSYIKVLKGRDGRDGRGGVPGPCGPQGENRCMKLDWDYTV